MKNRVFVIVGLVCLSQGVRAKEAGDGNFPWRRVEGIDASDYKTDFLKRVAQLLEEIPCYGRCTESVAVCLKKDPPHTTAVRLARGVFLLAAHTPEKEAILEWVEKRKKMAHPETTHEFNLEGLTPLGSKDANVTIVEFSDFQCPFCAKVTPILEKVIEDSDGKARLFFKQFPIKGHPRSLAASKACVATSKFGKFWQYCPKLFENRLHLTDAKFVDLARECGIDVDEFTEEMESEAVLDRIADEKMEGLRSKVKGTPAIFINGKEMLLEPTASMLMDRIQEELDILNGRD